MRRGLDDLLAVAAAGDTVVTTRLDRLGRSLPHLLDLVEELTTRGVGSAVDRAAFQVLITTGHQAVHRYDAGS
jgi:DNA invertase Pin-like site-specific DNA recombinase